MALVCQHLVPSLYAFAVLCQSVLDNVQYTIVVINCYVYTNAILTKIQFGFITRTSSYNSLSQKTVVM